MSKLVNEGETRIGQILFGSQLVDSNLYLGIYLNSTEPSETATLTDITEVSLGNGYARVVLSRGSWVITGDTAEYAKQTFVASGGNWGNCVGYFIATSTDNTGILLFVENFSQVFMMTNGNSCEITPRIRVA